MQRARAARCVQVAGCSLVAAHSRCACGVGLGVLETYLWHSSWSAEREISTSSSGKCGAADSPCAPPERVPSCASAPACASRARVCQRAVGQRGTAEPLPRHCSHRFRAHKPQLICADGLHATCGPRFPRYLCLSSGAELTPASVNPGMPSARTHPPHCRQRSAVPTVCGQLCTMPPLLRC